MITIGNASSVVFSVGDYLPGDYNLTIDATDVFGQSTTVVVPLFLSGNTDFFDVYYKQKANPLSLHT